MVTWLHLVIETIYFSFLVIGVTREMLLERLKAFKYGF